MSAYELLRYDKALAHTRQFWTVHQIMAFIMPSALGFIGGIAVRSVGWSIAALTDKTTLLFALLCAAAACLISWVASFLVNYVWSAPASLHHDQEGTIARQTEELDQLRKRPVRTDAEDHHFRLAQAGLRKIGPKGLATLRHLSIHGTLSFGAQPPPLPSGINMSDTLDLLIAAELEQLVTSKQVQYPGGWERTFEIAPGMKNALQELLYS